MLHLLHSSDLSGQTRLPGLCLRVARCHHCEGHQDSIVKASAEFDHDGLWVSIPGIFNKVLELV